MLNKYLMHERMNEDGEWVSLMSNLKAMRRSFNLRDSSHSQFLGKEITPKALTYGLTLCWVLSIDAFISVDPPYTPLSSCFTDEESET